jgi:hypothetical protein
MISGWRLDLIILYSNKAQGHSVDGYIGGAICCEYQCHWAEVGYTQIDTGGLDWVNSV